MEWRRLGNGTIQGFGKGRPTLCTTLDDLLNRTLTEFTGSRTQEAPEAISSSLIMDVGQVVGYLRE